MPDWGSEACLGDHARKVRKPALLTLFQSHPSSTTSKPKLAPITSLASSTAHAKDWDDVVTAHAGDRFARTWSTQNKRLGKYALEGEGVVMVSFVRRGFWL